MRLRPGTHSFGCAIQRLVGGLDVGPFDNVKGTSFAVADSQNASVAF